jgi:glycerol kinase
MAYLLALDQGTTSSRAIVFDERGAIVAQAQHALALAYPHPGWVEADPHDIWRTQKLAAREALAACPGGVDAIAAVGIANQRETTLLWDRATGEPLANAIVWQDRRTAQACEALRAQGHAGLVERRTGLVIDAYFSASKLQWLLRNVPGARARAERGELCFGTVDSWLVWRLSGGAAHVTDPSNAARTMLFDIHRQCWDEELLALFGIPAAVLPRVVASSGVCAHTDAEALGAVLPIAGLAGDQQAATFGQACHRPGMAKNTYGTGCFMLMHTGARAVASHNQLLTTIGWRAAGATCYMLEGSVFMGGATVQWLRDGLGLIASSADVEALAASVPDTGGVALVPAFTGLGAPYWDPHARGTLLGMTRGTTGAHIARAALESIALQSADLLDAMQQDAAAPLTELRVDGGASANDMLMQFQADVLGVPVLRPRVIETTALGAAYLAGLACGVWPDEAAIAAQWQLERCFEPRLPAEQRAATLARWRRAVAAARCWRGDESA